MSNSHKILTSKQQMHFLLAASVLMLSRSGMFMSDARAQNQKDCENVVAEAQKLYDDGRFSPAITLLRVCLPDGVPVEQRVGAYRLLAHALLAEDKSEKAKEAITKIFGLNRDYACDPAQDSQIYCGLVEEVKANIPVSTWEKLTGGWKKWLWYGGGIIGAGTAVYFANQNKTEPEQPLPEPPALP